jgi:hypothetical protein
VTIQFHLVVKLEVSLLDSFLDPHPEDPAVVDGVRIPVMEATVTFFFNPIGPKHRMPLGVPKSVLTQNLHPTSSTQQAE